MNDGERVLTEIQIAGALEENPAHIKASDIEAAVEALRITETQWYGEMAESRKADLWKGVFGVQKPGP